MARSPNRCVSYSVLVLFRYLSRRLLVVVVYIMWSNGKRAGCFSDDGRWMEINVLDLLRRATSFNGQHKHKKEKKERDKTKEAFFFLHRYFRSCAGGPAIRKRKVRLLCIAYINVNIIYLLDSRRRRYWMGHLMNRSSSEKGQPNHFFYPTRTIFWKKQNKKTTFSFIQSLQWWFTSAEFVEKEIVYRSTGLVLFLFWLCKRKCVALVVNQNERWKTYRTILQSLFSNRPRNKKSSKR